MRTTARTTATPIVTPTETATEITTETPIETPTETPTETLTPTSVATPTESPTASPAPRIRLSELMVDPLTVADNVGEFVELANADTQSVNLRDWTLVDGAGRSHTIAADLWLDPGAVRVLTRGDATALADYAPSDYQYSSLQLGNTSGSLALYPPHDAVPVDALTWGAGTSLPVQAGASFERVDPAGADWVIATTAWSTQHTDDSSPSARHALRPKRRRQRPPPLHRPSPTPTASPTATPTTRPRAAASPERDHGRPKRRGRQRGRVHRSWRMSTRSPSTCAAGQLIDGGGRSHVDRRRPVA
jgi:hypothetical protein